jgi:DNA-directed RNA polymerase subunit RPC12/RpoP
MDALKVPLAESVATVAEAGHEDALSAQQSRYVFEHSTCAMCDSNLEVRHQINRTELKVREEAHCPSCGIRVRSTHHLMH